MAALAERGLKAQLWKMRCTSGTSAREIVYRATYKAFTSRFGGRGVCLPDVFFIPDDYSAMAALVALDACGIAIPEDVSVVAWSARGSFPFYRKSVTRLETDPSAAGLKFSRLVLDSLSGKAMPRGVVLGSTFVLGET